MFMSWISRWTLKCLFQDFPGSPVVKTPCFPCRRHRFMPGWGIKIPHAGQHSQKKKKKKVFFNKSFQCWCKTISSKLCGKVFKTKCISSFEDTHTHTLSLTHTLKMKGPGLILGFRFIQNTFFQLHCSSSSKLLR